MLGGGWRVGGVGPVGGGRGGTFSRVANSVLRLSATPFDSGLVGLGAELSALGGEEGHV